MTSARESLFVSPQWLAERLDDPSVVPVDGSWYLPTMQRDAKAEFAAGHVPGAAFFDVDAISDRTSDLPHMLPSEAEFSAAAGALGIGDGDTIVVYDGDGLYSAPRVRWSFRVMGAANVVLLEGGLPAWKAAGLPLETGPSRRDARTFAARLDRDRVADRTDVAAALADGSRKVVDARPADRFTGATPEPRAGLRSGHMPGAASLPFGALVAGGRLKPAAEVEAAFRAAGVDPKAPAITSCGSGVTASILALGLESLGNADAKLYDGSWAEWGSRDDTAVVKG